MIRLYYKTIVIDDIRHVHYLCFSLSLVEGKHREHVQLVEVDAPEVAHVDCTMSLIKMSRIHNSKSVRGRSLLLMGCVRRSLPWRVERPRSVNYLHQVVCRLNRCTWYAPCIMLLRNFPRGHSHAGGGGTVSNSV